MSADKKPASNTPDWTVIVGLKRTKFEQNVRRQIEIKEEIAVLNEELGTLKSEGVKLLIKADVKSVLFEGRSVTRMDGSSTSFDKKKFYKLGGDQAMDWYERSLVKTPFTTMLIGKPREEGDAD
jgi:hypothetical protein